MHTHHGQQGGKDNQGDTRKGEQLGYPAIAMNAQ